MVVDVNPFLIEMLGLSRETFLGKKIWELGFFKDIIANQANFVELKQKGYIRYENKPLEASDGRRAEVEFVSNVYEVDHQKVIQYNIRDVTERKHAEEQIQRIQTELKQSNRDLLARNHQRTSGRRTRRQGSALRAGRCRLGQSTIAAHQARHDGNRTLEGHFT